jgi:transposase
MAQTYSTDLRVRFVRAVAAGASARAAGLRFAIAPTTAIRWAKVWRERGEQRAQPRGRPPQGSKLDRHEGFLLDLIEHQRDITLRAIAERLADERGVSAAASTIWRFYHRHGITLKKDRARRRAAARRRRRAAPGLVRAPARSRTGALGVH